MSESSEHLRPVARLWSEHRRAPFPAGLRGSEIGGTDLVLLDANTAGCVLTWLNNGGALDGQGIRALHECIEDLDRIVPRITVPAGARYYARLRQLAVHVARACPDTPWSAPGRTAPGQG
ncbi:hypothetical protein AB0907_35910 [Streptomyces sp. NPDC006975]|uniref:hypothetical protein n=1 Tax=unclassified Streptomyces TaxID=2593676 RepID=UPI00345603C7